MIYKRIHIDGSLQLDADEAATTRLITQEVTAVARRHERGHTPQLLHLSAVRTLQRYRGQLHEVLQRSHTCSREAVELVYIDEPVRGHTAQTGLLLCQVEGVGIEHLQGGGTMSLAN